MHLIYTPISNNIGPYDFSINDLNLEGDYFCTYEFYVEIVVINIVKCYKFSIFL
jgi:hypothetical protein